MANKIIYFSGEIKWAKVKQPDPKFDVYTLDLYLDEDSLSKFKLSGLGLKLRTDDNGEYIKLRRKVSKVVKGEVVDNGPPAVLLKDEGGDYKKFDGLIGNGSTGVCKVRVYDTQKGPGHELVTVAIDSLVEYEAIEGDGEYPF